MKQGEYRPNKLTCDASDDSYPYSRDEETKMRKVRALARRYLGRGLDLSTE